MKAVSNWQPSIELAKTGWQNRLYLGDNLAVLRNLKSDHDVKGKVKLVYIDPPYGTGQEFTVSDGRQATVSRTSNGQTAYSDTLTGTAYLEFLHPRIELLKDLLAEDGSIYVHIDCKMSHYVKVLLDQIFGPDRFKNEIARIKCNPKNFKRKGYANIKDTILFYTKTERFVWNYPREPFSNENITRLFPKTDSQGRRYATTPLHAPGETRNGPTGEAWKGLKPPAGRHWRMAPSELSRLDGADLIEWSPTGNPRRKIFADDALRVGKYRQDVWTFKDPPHPSYPTEKNLELLKTIVLASSNESDLVLDCFAGSGSTLVAAQHLGRRWIGVDSSEYAIETCSSRLGKLTSLAGDETCTRLGRNAALP